ncbi:oxygenase MpaB family protein [Trinickia mobilis]|uniref:oxygenase MpaB family protein n=1 Tax=Trinickia mobilis TaxID=2816356 RepID=UPI001A8CFBC0|nr:oxygenase MpaB family protein [Trinickia mobilis]
MSTESTTTPRPGPIRLADVTKEAYIYLGAGAAVVLQLAHPGVGQGVVEHSDTLRRPVDRLRTTMTFIYAVTLGTADERQYVARYVDQAHGPVRSASYSAFDPDLQRWVAATLFKGALTLHEMFEGPLAPPDRDALCREAAVYGTTLQMPAELWPGDLAAFDAYWTRSLAGFTVNEDVRRYVHALLGAEGAPWWIRVLMPLQRFATRGLLPDEIRRAFALSWTTQDERRWAWFVRYAPRLYRCVPGVLRRLPAAWVMRGFRRRMAGSAAI